MESKTEVDRSRGMVEDTQTDQPHDALHRYVVGDIMTHFVLAVSLDAALRTAIRAMRDNEIRHLPIVADHRIVGMLSEREFGAMAAVAKHFGADRAAYEAYLERPVREFMKARFLDDDQFITLRPDDTLQRAMDLMVRYRLTAMPVVDDDDNLVGMVSYVDIFETLLGETA